MKFRLPWLHDPLLHLLAGLALIAAAVCWSQGASEGGAPTAAAHGHAQLDACIVCRALPAELTAEPVDRPSLATGPGL